MIIHPCFVSGRTQKSGAKSAQVGSISKILGATDLAKPRDQMELGRWQCSVATRIHSCSQHKFIESLMTKRSQRLKDQAVLQLFDFCALRNVE